MSTVDAILLGGGAGSRFTGSSAGAGKAPPKQFQLLGDSPVFIHALRSLLTLDCFRQIVVAVPGPLVETAQEQVDLHVGRHPKTLVRVIEGGNRRQDSSRKALEALDQVTPTCTRVLIHDACRPFLSEDFLERVRERLFDRSYGAWIPVVPVVDTLKRVDNQAVVETVDRSALHHVQTPQIFEYGVIRSLAEKIQTDPELAFTDDASLCEYFGIPVGVFEGDTRNIKITYPFDLASVRGLMAEEGGQRKCASESATTPTA